MKYKNTCYFNGYRPQNLPFGFDQEDARRIAPKRELSALITEQNERGEGR